MLPVHHAASLIADSARQAGYDVRRHAASAFSRSAYVFVNGHCIRVADHPPGKRRRFSMDVWVGQPRDGAVTPGKAVRLVPKLFAQPYRPGRD